VIRKNRYSAFTLVEVMIALAIAASAFLMILQINNASLFKCTRACLAETITSCAESKLDEVVSGIEMATTGDLLNLPGYRWRVTRTAGIISPLETIQNVRIEITSSDGNIVATLSMLLCTLRKTPQ
jgi:prepilin-type N-terminal cleavage/methylation domain-containing protein